jgi:hypothetical protein
MEQTLEQQALAWLRHREELQQPLFPGGPPMSNKPEAILVDLQPEPLRSAIERVLAKG